MKKAGLFLAPLLFFLAVLAPRLISAVPPTQEEFVAPVESVSTLRFNIVPCYNKTQKGMARSISGVDVVGEECRPSVLPPKRADRPDFEATDPGMPVQPRAF